MDGLTAPSSITEKIDAMMNRHDNKSEFNLGLSFVCLSVLRYLVIHREKAHIALCRRMVDKYDLLGVLIGFIEFRPWTRVDKSTKTRLNFNSSLNTWVPYTDNLPLPEACVWLMLISLILGGDTDYNPQTVLALRKYITPSLVDQIPLVEDLKHHLEQLNMMQTMGGQNKRAPKIDPLSIVELEETQYERFKTHGVLHTIKPLSPEEEQACATAIMNVYETQNLEGFAYTSLIEPDHGPVCCVCGVQGALHRCSKCKSATYCSRACQVKDWPHHRSKC